ncbi:SCP2 sterol-binding domain-containing protein [Plantactinospora sp. S1510]|uniref:SCP2 sterol-binding domain-containing protein n=1 Tax=Plantactinospora alkalitolerans TaxID=2789879 RepID=A0ABS0H2Z2_9ACTN|nr:SCP2 sterol-binding domain-containing protein [Plantactinospora alkalitolerans]MBF9132661.1 SCP2 sterol-binding domain-containing protein [Plantactinospora alkalitolerans]
MTDRTAEYFAGPARRRMHLLPSGFAATIRLDLRRPDRMDRWYLTLGEDEFSFRRDGEREADLVIAADGEVFDRLVAGEDPTTAALRNEITYRGPPLIMIYFERLLPGPPDSHGPERVPGRGGGDHGR